MKKSRRWIVMFLILVLVGGVGYAAYVRYPDVARYFSSSHAAMAGEPPEPVLETATVTQGDIVITVDGSGELTPAAELALTFRVSGVLAETLAVLGEQVHKGDLLAQLEADDLARAVAEAEVELELARLALADVREGPSEAELADARAALRDAQVEAQLAWQAYQDVGDVNQEAVVEARKVDYDWWVGYYQRQKARYEAGELSQIDHDWAMAAMIEAEGKWQKALNQMQIEQSQAQNRLARAQNTVYQAQEQLALLESEPLTNTLVQAELDVDQALIALENARADLEAAHLYAPFDGVVMDVTATAGERVGENKPILTLADLREPLLRFWVEEMDASSVALGVGVNVVFEAWPDDVFTGEVIRVDPVLATVSGTPALQAYVRLDLTERAIILLSGLTADVEVIAAEARGVTLAPVEALHETSPGEYVAYVVRPDGELEMRAVTVGLMNVINFEALSGLRVGEVVVVGGLQ